MPSVVKTNITSLRKKIDRKRRKIEVATVWTLNELARKVSREHLPKQVGADFEGGATQFTKRGFKYRKAVRGSRMYSSVYIDDAQADYMQHMVKGRTVRTPDKRYIPVPTKHSRKAKFGHIARGEWTKFENKEKYFFGIPRGFDKMKKKAGDGRGIWERYSVWRGQYKGIKMVAALKEVAKYPRLYFHYYVKVHRYVSSPTTGFLAVYKRKLAEALR